MGQPTMRGFKKQELSSLGLVVIQDHLLFLIHSHAQPNRTHIRIISPSLTQYPRSLALLKRFLIILLRNVLAVDIHPVDVLVGVRS